MWKISAASSGLCPEPLAPASDESLVDKMKTRLAADGYRFRALVEAIVTSPQFLNKRAPEVAESSMLDAARRYRHIKAYLKKGN